MVLTISVEVVQLSVDLCHLTMEPVWPERVSIALLDPEQTVVEPEMVPPTEIGSTMRVASAELMTEQMPL